MQPVIFTLTPAQRARMRNLALGAATLEVALVAVSLATGRHLWLFVICAGIAVVAFGLSYLGQRAAFAKVDTHGITARVFFNIHKRCTWTDIADISARSRQNNRARGRYVVVERVSGRRLALPAPISTDVFPDPEFDQKLAAIRRAWRTSKAG